MNRTFLFSLLLLGLAVTWGREFADRLIEGGNSAHAYRVIEERLDDAAFDRYACADEVLDEELGAESLWEVVPVGATEDALLTPVRQSFVMDFEEEGEAAPVPLSQKFVDFFSQAIEMVKGERRKITHEIRRGDTLARIWLAHGASPQSAHLAARALNDSGVSAGSFRLGEKVELEVTVLGDIRSFVRHMDDGRTLIIERAEDGSYEHEIIEHEIRNTRKNSGGVITSCFSDAAHKNAVPPEIVDEMADLLGSRIEFRKDIQPGDTFSVIYEERVAENGVKLAPGPIVAASIVSDGKTFAAVRHVAKNGKAVYFNEKGFAQGDAFLRYPLKFTRISSVFASARFHPVLKKSRPHNGVDFAAPTGTPVRTIGDGLIDFAGWTSGGGYTVRVRHDARYTTAYLHLSKIGRGVTQGKRISRGDVIGAVGSTGLATGPHLHFSLYDKGKYIDPLSSKLPAIMAQDDMIPNKYLMQVLAELNSTHESVRMAWADGRKLG